MFISEMPQPANPTAVTNVGLMPTAHLMAVLLREGRLTVADVEEIFREARTRYTNTPAGQAPTDDWARQTSALLALVYGDVVKYGAKPKTPASPGP